MKMVQQQNFGVVLRRGLRRLQHRQAQAATLWHPGLESAPSCIINHSTTARSNHLQFGSLSGSGINQWRDSTQSWTYFDLAAKRQRFSVPNNNNNTRLFSSTSNSSDGVPPLSEQDTVLLQLTKEKRFDKIEQLLEVILVNETDLSIDANTFHAILSRSANHAKKNKTAGFQTEALLGLLVEFQRSHRIQGDDIDLVKMFTICIRAWAKSGHDEAGEKAEAILNSMIENSSPQGQEEEEAGEYSMNELQPDSIVYTSVINCYAKLGDTEGAERVFLRMFQDYQNGNEKAKPDLFSFATRMKAFANSGAPDAGDQATSLLNQMHEFNLQVDKITYTAVMQAYARQGKATEAQGIFERMIQDYEAGNESAKPDTFAFGTLVKALAVSRAPDAGDQAQAILERMQQYDLEPDRDTLLFVKRCWDTNNKKSASTEKEDAASEAKQ